MAEKIEELKQEPDSKSTKSVISVVIQSTSILLTISAIFYAIKTRSFENFIEYGFYIDGGALIIAAVYFVFCILKFGYKNRPKAALKLTGLMFLIALPIMPIVYYSISISVKDLYFWILSPLHHKSFITIFISVVTVYLGLILFYFRYKFRAIYGFSEAVVGIMGAAYKVSDFEESLISFNYIFIILLASVYLVVRGFDNIYQGFTKEPKDKMALKIYNFFFKVSEI